MKRHAIGDNGIGDRHKKGKHNHRAQKQTRKAMTTARHTKRQYTGTQEEIQRPIPLPRSKKTGIQGRKREKRDRRDGPGCRSKGRLPVGIDRITWLPNVTVSALPVAQPSPLMRLPLPGVGGVDRSVQGNLIQDCFWPSRTSALTASLEAFLLSASHSCWLFSLQVSSCPFAVLFSSKSVGWSVLDSVSEMKRK